MKVGRSLKSVTCRNCPVAVDSVQMFVVTPSVSGIASHRPSGESDGFTICHCGARLLGIRKSSRAGASCGSRHECRTPDSHPRVPVHDEEQRTPVDAGSRSGARHLQNIHTAAARESSEAIVGGGDPGAFPFSEGQIHAIGHFVL